MICTGVVGLGIGSHHALAVLENPRCKLTHLCELDFKKVNNFRKTHSNYSIQHVTFEELVENDHVQMVTLASFDDSHYQQVMDCLNHNKHVFVEKPLCQTWEQLISLHQVCKSKQCGLMSNLVLRTSELFKYINTIIVNGELGDIFYFEGDYLYGRLEKITEGWRKDVKNYSVMEGGGIHIIDLMVNLTGQKPSHVSSVSNKIATQDTSFIYSDFQSSTFYFSSGLVAQIKANFGCMHPHQHIIKVYGTKGTFIYDDQGPRLFKERFDEAQPKRIKYKAKPINKGMLVHKFIQEIEDKNFVSSQREFDLMSIVIASEKALQCDGKVEVKYL